MPQENNRTWKIDIDVPLLIVLFAVNLVENVYINFVIFHTCTNTLGYNETECVLLNLKESNMTKIEEKVQSYASVYLMARTILTALIPACFGLFIGPWSDQHGRKLLLICPQIGCTLSCSLLMVLSFFPQISPWLIVTASLPVAMLGGATILISGVFCYITDVVPVNDRAVRIGILQGVITLGILLGQLSSAPLFRITSYSVVFACGALSFALSTIYTIFCIKESVPIERRLAANTRMFNWKHVQDLFYTCCQERENNKRFIVWAVMVSLALMMFALDGKFQIEYLFVREKFHWGLQEYAVFNSLSSVITITGSMLGIYFLNKICKISEVLLGILSFVSSSILCTVNAISFESWQMYAISPIGMLEGMGSPMCRTLLSKTVPESDIGKVFALTACIESLIPLLSAPAYTYLYRYTLSTFSGAFYLLSAAIKTICALLFGCILYTSDSQSLSNENYVTVINETEEIAE